MNIGIITFHWGANHGAVLQVYALSEYLKRNYNANVEVIDYCPQNMQINFRNVIKSRKIKTFIRKMKELYKNECIAAFRENLNLSEKYSSNKQLIEGNLKYDLLITGSDQIWNPSFLLNGEGKITPVYFLNFGHKKTKKISVSASFGCEKYPKECQEIVLPLLKKFDDISVRENSGKEILETMGIEATVTADPTALLQTKHYLDLCNKEKRKDKIISKMILRKQSKEINRLLKDIYGKYNKWKIVDIEKYSIPNWLAAIRDSRLVITNSFHCVMMCLKLHTPFIVILEDGVQSGMNDRFKTLLYKFSLSNRIISSIEDLEKIEIDIDFEKVDIYMKQYAASLTDFLDRNIY